MDFDQSHNHHPLRTQLRAATTAAHDRLDTAIRKTNGWSSRDAYTNFLEFQLRARQPVEAWLAQNASKGLTPPAQTPLIASDLAALQVASQSESHPFPLEPEPNLEAQALGVAWVLAGSALGNRAILKDIKANMRTEDLPVAFLSDAAMLKFWQSLRPVLEHPFPPSQSAAACGAANAIFAHFLSLVRVPEHIS